MLLAHSNKNLLTAEDDVRNLKHVFSNAPTPAAKVAIRLQRMMNMFQADVIRDFLFTTTEAHMKFMMSKSFPTSAFLKRCSEVTVTPSSLSSLSMSRSVASMVTIPAFTAESIDVGFGIVQVALLESDMNDASSSKRIPYSDQLCNFRYACDTSDASYVIVQEMGPEIFMVWTEPVLSTKRHRTAVRFCKRKLWHLIYGESESTPSERQLLGAVNFVVVIDESRRCPYCGASPTNPCACSLESHMSIHGKGKQIQNASLFASFHSGSFEGIAKLSTYINGAVLSEKARGIQFSMEGVAAPEVVARLTQWSVTEHLRSKNLRAFNHKMLSISLHETRLGAVDTPLYDSDDMPRQQHMSSEIVNQGSSVRIHDDGFPDLNYDFDHTTTEQNSPVQTASMDISKQDLIFDTSDHELALIDQAMMRQEGEFETEQEAERQHQIAATQIAPLGMMQTTSTGQLEVTDGNSHQIGYHSFREENGQAVPARHLTTLEELEQSSVYGKDSSSDTIMKKMRRKAANRESARRSNLKRKIRREAMRAELELLKSQEQDLRLREVCLRDENIRLWESIVAGTR